MKQYCRYCGYMVVGDANYCTKHKQTMSTASAKSVNRCSDFAFNPIDAFGENEKGYQPKENREPKKAQCDGQLDMSVALRTKCQVKDGYPCTYYVASQYRYRDCGEECKSKCCYGCEEKSLCGYACNASRQ